MGSLLVFEFEVVIKQIFEGDFVRNLVMTRVRAIKVDRELLASLSS